MPTPSAVPTLIPTYLRCEWQVAPLAIERPDPRLSWELTAPAGAYDVVQSAYRIQVAATSRDLAAGTNLLWDSGIVASAAQSSIHYAGTALVSFQRVFWRVQIIDGQGTASSWSDVAPFAMGIRERSGWKGSWVHSPLWTSNNSPYYRRSFTTTMPVVDARLYVTARGIFRAAIDGQLIADEQLAPGWTDYKKRILYRCHDLTASLATPGEHVLGAQLNIGWYMGPVGWEGKAHLWGWRTELLMVLRLEHADGSVAWVTTDEQWRTANSPTLSSSFLKGEIHDRGLEVDGWDKPGYVDSAWHKVNHSAIEEAPLLQAHSGPPVRALGVVKPVNRWQARPGCWIFDLGENIAGRVRLTITAAAGTTVRLRHGEMVTPDRNLYVDNLRSALSMDVYTAAGTGVETFEPRFTFHGFQYVELTGWPGEPPMDCLTGIIIGSDCPAAGTFSCSEPMVDKLQANIVRTQRANYIEVPTDCPQRDERLGWTGDAQAYIRTAICNRDISAFFTKWLQDLRDAQNLDGTFPNVAPQVPGLGDSWNLSRGDAGWADAGTICPMTLWQCYGDKDLLAASYPSMVKWVEYLERTAVEGVFIRYQSKTTLVFGDWLQVDCWTPPEIIMTAFFAHSTELLAQAARILGKDADAVRFEKLFGQVCTAFTKEFMKPDGRVIGKRSEDETQTNYLLALHFNLLPEANRAAAFGHLVTQLAKRDYHLSTGFLGLPYLLPVLTRYGRVDLAYRLLMNTGYPSWLYPITQGATTIWERWNGWKKDEGPADPGMNSYSHYSYGACGEWLFSDVAGIERLEVGFAKIRIRPQTGGIMTSASATHRCLYGQIASSWHTSGNQIEMQVEVPPNTTAIVYIPTRAPSSIREGGRPSTRKMTLDDGYCVIAVGSGSYQFQAEHTSGSAAAHRATVTSH